MKLSVYIRICLLSLLIKLVQVHVHVCMCMRACAAHENVHSTIVPFILLFLISFLSVSDILKSFLTENENTEATFKTGINEMQLFSFIHFFQFQ